MDVLGKSVGLGGKARGLMSALFAFIFLAFIVAPAHANNNFPGTTITGDTGSLTASNVGATGQSGEPTTFGGGGLNSMWYSWTAPSNGTLTLQTCGGSTNYDTTLKTYTGSAVNALATVASNDDSCGLQSLNTVSVTSGTTYRVQVDGYASNTGTFTLSWSFISANNADLSLSKTVSNASPAFGSTVDYTLTVASSGASTQTASGITVTDILPVGVTFVTKVSGNGTYNAGTGIWTLANSIAPGTSRNIVLRVSVGATAGAVIVNSAEIRTSSHPDPDSTVNNGSTTEDDDDTASFTVSGSRVAGTPPSISGICTAASSTTNLLDWNSHSWTSGSPTGSATLTGIGTVNFSVATDGTYISPLELNSSNTGGFGAGQLSLYQIIEYTNITQTTTTTVTLPTAVPGAQFTVFDVDFANADFADKLVVTGSYNGSSVTPTMTNGVVNYTIGNIAIGDGGSGSTSANGNVVVTFSSPVDTISIEYGNHTTAPADPDGQAISIYDFTFCNPVADLSVSKISSVVSDGISASNPKAIPGATVRYCITVNNAGSGTATAVSASDNVPSDVAFVPGSMLTGTSCGSAASAEDDNASGADETDPFGMSFAAGGTNGTGVVTGTASSLAPGDSMALVFNVTLD